MFVVVELLIGVKVLIYSFGSADVMAQVLREVGYVLDQLNWGTSAIFRSNELDGPVAFLVVILGFMIFTYLLIMVMLPRIERSDRKNSLYEFD